MGLFTPLQRLFTGRQRFNLKNPADWRVFFTGTMSSSGASVTHDSALRYSAYYAPLMIRCRTVMALPKHVRRRTENGSTIDRNHDQSSLLSKRPNNFQSSRMFWLEFSFNRFHRGNGLAWLEGVEGPNGRPVAYYNLDPRRAVPDFQDGDLFIKYEGKTPHGVELGTRPYREFIHVPNDIGVQTDNGFLWGEGTYKYAREAIGLGLASEEIIGNFIKKEGFLHRYFATDKPLTREQREIIQESLKDYRPGGSRSGQMPLLDAGLSIEGKPLSIADIEPDELRKFMVEESARFHTFPALFKLGHHERSNFANAFQASVEFRDTTAIPDILPIIAECNYKLLTPRQFSSDSHFIHFETKGLLQSDPEQRANFHQTMANIGALSPNEALNIEDMDTAGPEGDQRFIMNNMIPLDLVKQYWETIINRATENMTPQGAQELIHANYAQNGGLSKGGAAKKG